MERRESQVGSNYLEVVTGSGAEAGATDPRLEGRSAARISNAPKHPDLPDELAQATGASRAALARDAYSYLHLPMVAGVVLFAFGLETTLHDVNDPLRIVRALGLCGGIALYLLAHVALRVRIGGGLGRGRPVATILLLVLLPPAKNVPALTALGLVAAVCTSLIGYEAIRYREGRAWIRIRRRAFTMEEAARAGGSRSRRRRGGQQLEEPNGSGGTERNS